MFQKYVEFIHQSGSIFCRCPAVVDDVLYVAGLWNDLNAYGESSGNATVNAYCYPDGQVQCP